MLLMVVTLAVFQLPMSWLKAGAMEEHETRVRHPGEIGAVGGIARSD